MKTRNVLGTKKKVILNHSNSELLFMESITEKEEEIIDNSLKDYISPRFSLDENLILYPSDIYLYGSIDLNDEHDVNLLLSKDIISENILEAAIIDSNFNYEKGTITSDENDRFLYHNTWDKFNWFKYNYCLLGKPERIIIYKIKRLCYYQYLHKCRINKYGESRTFLYR